MDLERLRGLGRPLHYFSSIDTTMRAAAELAERGEPAGAVVLAEEQTAGRGRLGRDWVSERGAGLYFSLILRPALSTSEAGVLPLALGLAVAGAIQRVSGLTCDLRWPNDVLLGERKCCGILCEMTAEGDRVRHVVAGIGVNVNHARMPEALSHTATSLRMETGREQSREALLEEILREADCWLEILAGPGPAAVIEGFTRASSYGSGKRVVVSNGAERLAGVTAGLTPAGTLLLRCDDGVVVPILAGSVRPETE